MKNKQVVFLSVLLLLSLFLIGLLLVSNINLNQEFSQVQKDNTDLQNQVDDFEEKLNNTNLNTEKTKDLAIKANIDNIWNSYTDHELGFMINYPVRSVGGFNNVTKDGDVVFIYNEQVEDDVQRRKEYSSSFDKVKGITFAILTQSVANDEELTQFIKDRYGDSCEIREKRQSEKAGTYNILIDSSSENFEDCFINYGIIIKYSPEKGKVSAWDLGQSVTFFLNNEALDLEMVDSFEFLP